ncbi:MAG: DUF465 domain-containing protein [Thermoanaerobaculia bacterium]|nr:DUF465 domain-containing protein [Thermoanaerobaculia bacterium]
MELDPVKQELLESDDDFRSLYEEHKQCKERLVTLRHKSLLSEDDEMEMKRIKLHKLSLKDRMETLARERVQAVA